MQQVSLSDIEREATLLEIDMSISDGGFLNLTKRGDASLFYHSLQPLDDPHTLQGAWQWLQHYRINLSHSDEIRELRANGKPARQHIHLVTNRLFLFMAQCSVVLILGSIIFLLLDNFFVRAGAFMVMVIAIMMLDFLISRRRTKQCDEAYEKAKCNL